MKSIMSKFIQPGKVSCLIDGQWGSTGKGLFAAYIAQVVENIPDICTTNASANAGHTTILPGGKKMVCFHLPTAGVLCKDSMIYLNAGSIIDPELLEKEMKANNVSPDRVFIDPMAGVITPECREEEGARGSSATKLASTQKGVGASLIRKIRRDNMAVVKEVPGLFGFMPMYNITGPINLNISMRRENKSVFVEIPQGFDLSINRSGFFPYCTSREVTVMQGLSDAGIAPFSLYSVAMIVRTFPIRVGNIYDENKEQIGWSGPHHVDQEETSWEKIGQEPEKTTVTGRVRRVFTWSKFQFEQANSYNRPEFVMINFMNYLIGDVNKAESITRDVAGCVGRDHIIFGTGPKTEDVMEEYNDVVEFLRG